MIITLCGSTRFRNEFTFVNALLTLAGHVVISVGLFGGRDWCAACGHPRRTHENDDPEHPCADGACPCGSYRTLSDAEKNALDALHFRKIEMADAVFVVDPESYVGESTTREIRHAESLNMPVYYLSDGALDHLRDARSYPR